MRVYRPISSPPGHFLFFPSSNRTAANENAQLLSPHLPPTKSTCLKFWAYKPYSCKGGCGWESLSGVTRMPFGIFCLWYNTCTHFCTYAADSQLRVWRLSQGRLHQLLVVSELGGPWKRFDVNITSDEEYQVRLSLTSKHKYANRYRYSSIKL